MEVISHRNSLNKFKNTRIMRNLSIASLLYNPIKRKRDADISHQRNLKYTYEDTYPSLGAFTGGIEPMTESSDLESNDESNEVYEEHEITWWESLCTVM